MTFTLETPRLLLRTLEPDDLDFVALMLADPMVMRFYPRRYDRDEAVMWIDRQQARYARDGHGLWLAEERTSGEPVGQVGLVMQSVDGEELPEIGYLLHHRWWKRGLATEAACAVRDWAFGERGYPRLISLIRPVNSPSRRVAERVGMVRWKETVHAGLPHDVFSITRPDADRPHVPR
jgi:RimJ/RimL family protein N-acetyltransferase